MNNSRLGSSSSSRAGLSGSNDDSSVVSLKTLVAKSNRTQPAVQDTSSDDSGLIDLKKLMANAPPSSGALPPVLAPSEAGLFAMPEAMPSPHVSAVSDVSKEAPSRDARARTKWLAGAAFIVLAAAGTIGVLHARTTQAADVQRGVVAAADEPKKFVQAPPAVDTPTAVADVVPAAIETQAPAETSRPGRQAAIRTPSRNQARTEATTTSNTGNAKQPPSAACDLMCEMRRAAKK